MKKQDATGYTDNTKYPDRKSPRAHFHDYSGGEYFVTICTHDKKHYFGKIHNDNIWLTPIGLYCHQELESIPEHYPYAEILASVVMPNHIHAIIRINNDIDTEIPQIRPALSVVIGGFKRAVTVFARRNDIDFAWQSRFHDHIIRGVKDRNSIAAYIENNIGRWEHDCYY